MKKITLSLIIGISMFLFSSCWQHKCNNQDKSAALNETQKNNSDVEKIKHELMNKDIEFSNYSEKNGTNDAFINYIADNGVLLRPNSNPIVGKDTVTALLNKNKSKKKNSDVLLKWVPLFADVACSGDLGYTYGTYTSTYTTNGKTDSEYGTYVTVWKKDKNGNWKFVIDCGNDGLTPLNKKTKQ